jgi:hypothetical protein
VFSITQFTPLLVDFSTFRLLAEGWEHCLLVSAPAHCGGDAELKVIGYGVDTQFPQGQVVYSSIAGSAPSQLMDQASLLPHMQHRTIADGTVSISKV